MGVHLLRNLPAGSIHLGSFELIRLHYAKKQGIPVSNLDMGVNLLAGGVGGFLYWFIFFPIDVVRQSL